MALFEPTNLRQETAAGESLVFDRNRYVRNTTTRHGFLRNEQTASGTQALTIEPARDQYQPGISVSLSRQNEIQSQDSNTQAQRGIDAYRANEGLINRSRTESQNATPYNNEQTSVLLTGNQIQPATAEIPQPTGINAVIQLQPATQTNLALQEYSNLSTTFDTTQNTIRSDADSYLRTQQAVPLGAQLLTTLSDQNQSENTITPPPTVNLALSRGIEQYVLNSAPVEENGSVDSNTVDLYISANPTQRLMTQLLP